MDLRTWLRPPSQPIIQRPRNVFVPPGVSTVAVTPSPSCVTPATRCSISTWQCGIFLEHVEQDVANLVLLEHQPVRVRRVVREHAEIEIGDHAGAAVAILVVAHDIAAREHGIGDAALCEHLQRRRMDGAGARIVEDLGRRPPAPSPGCRGGRGRARRSARPGRRRRSERGLSMNYVPRCVSGPSGWGKLRPSAGER